MVDIGKFYSELSALGKGLFVAAIICFVLAVMDQVVLGAIFAHMNVMDAEINAKRETVRRNMRILAFKDRILEEYDEYSAYLDTGDNSEEEIVGALLRKIEHFAKKQEISIINIKPGDVEENPVFKVYKTGLECEGPLNNLLSFMSLLEESDYLFQITRYDMVPKNKKGEVIKCNMDISRTLITVEDVPG